MRLIMLHKLINLHHDIFFMSRTSLLGSLNLEKNMLNQNSLLKQYFHNVFNMFDALQLTLQLTLLTPIAK